MRLPKTWDRWVANKLQHTQNLEEYILTLDKVVEDMRDLLPGEKKPLGTFNVLETFSQKAVLDIGVLMAACVDYRNLLIRADVPDSVSGRQPGVEEIMNRYGIEISKRKQGHEDLFTARITGGSGA